MRVLRLLENEDGGALAHHEAVELGVDRAAGSSGILIATRERAQGSKPGE